MVSPYVHAHIKNLADFNLAVLMHTAKPPNFPAIRYYIIHDAGGGKLGLEDWKS